MIKVFKIEWNTQPNIRESIVKDKIKHLKELGFKVTELSGTECECKNPKFEVYEIPVQNYKRELLCEHCKKPPKTNK